MSRRGRFVRILVLVTGVCQVPFVVAAAELGRRLGFFAPWLLAVALGVASLVVFFGRAEKLMTDRPRPFWRVALADVPYYTHWCACLFCLIPSVLYAIGAPIFDLATGRRIHLAPTFFVWLYAIGLALAAYGTTIRRWFFVVRRVEVPIRGLAPGLDGYTIAQLSDLHIGAMTPLFWGRRWVRAANDANADAVVVTGDMVTNGVEFHEDIATLLGELRGKDGVFVSMGNHDYFGEGEPLVSLVRARGVHVLRNEGRTIEKNGGRLFLTAVDDTWTRRADLVRALGGRPEGVPTVLLAHDPDQFPSAASHGVDLVLAGHTHGGQVAVPFLARHLNMSRLAHRFHLGLYREKGCTLYVHPGLGTTGPPVRLGVAPAVVVLTLRAAAS